MLLCLFKARCGHQFQSDVLGLSGVWARRWLVYLNIRLETKTNWLHIGVVHWNYMPECHTIHLNLLKSRARKVCPARYWILLLLLTKFHKTTGKTDLTPCCMYSIFMWTLQLKVLYLKDLSAAFQVCNKPGHLLHWWEVWGHENRRKASGSSHWWHSRNCSPDAGHFHHHQESSGLTSHLHSVCLQRNPNTKTEWYISRIFIKWSIEIPTFIYQSNV